MHLLIPLLSLASVAVALPSPSEPLVWSRVDTSKPTSTSPLVWSRVETSKPSTTSSSSPLVWSRVNTEKTISTSTSTTTTPQWTRVTRSRPLSTSTSSSTVSVPSSAPSPSPVCPTGGLKLNATTRLVAGCYQSKPLEWNNIQTYLNYRPFVSEFYDKTLTNGTGYYSGSISDCPEVIFDPHGTASTLRIAVSDELAAQFGGMDKMCGKKLVITSLGKPGSPFDNIPSRAIVTRRCSPEFCPGISIGTGFDWYTPPALRGSWFPDISKGFRDIPSKLHEAKENSIAWVDWDEMGKGGFNYY